MWGKGLDLVKSEGAKCWGAECGGGQGQSPLGVQVLCGREPCILGLFCWDPVNILYHTKLGPLITEIRFQSGLVTMWKLLIHFN